VKNTKTKLLQVTTKPATVGISTFNTETHRRARLSFTSEDNARAYYAAHQQQPKRKKKDDSPATPPTAVTAAGVQAAAQKPQPQQKETESPAPTTPKAESGNAATAGSASFAMKCQSCRCAWSLTAQFCEYEGVTYCEPCYLRLLCSCNHCGKLLQDNEQVVAVTSTDPFSNSTDSKQPSEAADGPPLLFHRDCLRCSHCKRALRRFSVIPSQNPGGLLPPASPTNAQPTSPASSTESPVSQTSSAPAPLTPGSGPTAPVLSSSPASTLVLGPTASGSPAPALSINPALPPLNHSMSAGPASPTAATSPTAAAAAAAAAAGSSAAPPPPLMHTSSLGPSSALAQNRRNRMAHSRGESLFTGAPITGLGLGANPGALGGGSDSAIYARGNKVFCRQDYSLLFSNRCRACRNFVLNDSQALLALGLYWHPACFRCAGPCGKPIIVASATTAPPASSGTPLSPIPSNAPALPPSKFHVLTKQQKLRIKPKPAPAPPAAVASAEPRSSTASVTREVDTDTEPPEEDDEDLPQVPTFTHHLTVSRF
jgi:hypothetical protein